MFTNRSAPRVMRGRSGLPRSAAMRPGDHRRRDFAFQDLAMQHVTNILDQDR
jgi:hypothetical protein